jgi:hypothetical protein
MIVKYRKNEFLELDFDSKCVVIEYLLPDEYFGGQMEINFYSEEDENGNLKSIPKELKVIEDLKFNKLLEKLTKKLFDENDIIEFDTDY